VVLIAAGRLATPARPHAYACGHLANSASLLLPVSNLTNLLAFTVSGLPFARFAELMALPWLAAIGVEYAVIRRFFAADLVPTAAPVAVPVTTGTGATGTGTTGTGATETGATGTGAGVRSGVKHGTVPYDGVESGAEPSGRQATDGPGLPVFTLSVVAATLGGFVLASAAGANPAWAALGGALVLAVRALARGEATAASIARSADVPFLLFVLALGVVVTALADDGLASALRPLSPTGSALPALLGFAALAAVLAAVVNNLPAVLLLLPLAAPAGAGAVLAVLLGVNIGPNLTYTGSLATLLWRRVLRGYGSDVTLGEFTRLAVLTVLPALTLAVLALWLGLRVLGG
jgi:arsenical pump membrane protein